MSAIMGAMVPSALSGKRHIHRLEKSERASFIYQILGRVRDSTDQSDIEAIIEWLVLNTCSNLSLKLNKRWLNQQEPAAPGKVSGRAAEVYGI